MSQWIVVEPCKAGSGRYLQVGEVVSDDPSLAPKLNELHQRGCLIQCADLVLTPVEPEPVSKEPEVNGDETQEAEIQEAGETVLDKPASKKGK